MNVFDIIILFWLLFGIAAGLKNGFTKQVISFIGFIAILYISFYLKNYVSVWMYQYLPFFNFDGIFKGVSVLNIALYEIIAFILVFIVLEAIFGLVLFVSGLVEKALAFLIIPGMISKILGAIFGFLEYFVIAFVILYILNLPVFDLKELKSSELSSKILYDTPLLSSQVSGTLKVIDEFASLKEKYEVSGTAEEFNLATLDLFLKDGVITIDNVDKLVENKKLQINNIESVLSKYRTEEEK